MWKKTRTHVSLIDQHQSSSKNGAYSESNLNNNDNNGEVNGSGAGRKRTNGTTTDNLSENEDFVENDFGPRNSNNNHPNDDDNFDDDLDDDDDDGDDNFNVKLSLCIIRVFFLGGWISFLNFRGHNKCRCFK